ncbi:UNVERIFIED_CONTAM: hypothetical protein Sindi_1758800 [Sesamum indicum]
MLRMWRRSTALVAKSGGVEDLSSWELVDLPLSDDEDIYSFDGDDVIPECKAPVEYEEEVEDAGESGALDGVNISLAVESMMTYLADVARHDMHHDGSHGYDDEEEGVYDDYDDDDDELLTWKLMRRLEKRRIKKTGGRRGGGGPKLRKSKRMQYYHNRPWCLHGLGVHHDYVGLKW